MKIGAANVEGLYTWPTASGEQFKDGADVVEALGLPAFKFYCTQQYLTQYPEQSSWSDTPTTCTEFLQLDEVAEVLGRPAFTDYAVTIFAFGNPANNWWRDAGHADGARLQTEYTEIYDAAVHLLTTYNDTGKTFVFQNWEGDWALMDAFDPATYVRKRDVDYNLAFHSARQRAVRDAMRDTPHTGVSVLYAVEVNRVLDVSDAPGRTRLLKDVLNRLQPDVVSYSAYDSTIATYGYGANLVEWQSLTNLHFARALDLIREHAPNSKIQIGEFGFEEARIAIDRPSYNVRTMVRTVYDVAAAKGVHWFYYWQVFDNEADGTTPSGVKGYWLKDPDGNDSAAALELQAIAGEQ